MRDMIINVCTPAERKPGRDDLVHVFIKALPFSTPCLFDGRDFRLLNGGSMIATHMVVEWFYGHSTSRVADPRFNNPHYKHDE